MTQYWNLDPETMWVDSTLDGSPYVSAELTDQYEDTDHENREFFFGDASSIPGIIDFLTTFMERHGK